MTEKKNKLTVVSLFAGAGGLDIAACSTGEVDRLFSTDSNPVFLQTLIDNMPIHFPTINHKYLVTDVRKLTGNMIQEALGTDEIDIVMGGPPCDDFTTFGRKKGTGGTKAPLIMDFARLIHELKPTSFLFENVPNLSRQFQPFFKEFLLSIMSNYGEIKWRILHAQDYGSPTLRKRLFAVGFKDRRQYDAFEFPSPIFKDSQTSSSLFECGLAQKPFVTISNVLDDLPDVNNPQAEKYMNHTGRPHKPKTVEQLRSIPQGGWTKKSYRYRAPWDGLCWSLTAGVDHSTKSYIHPIYHREMSVREYSRIHGFPDSWYFCGNHHNGIKQVANSVPVPLGLAVINSIFNVFGEGYNEQIY